MHIFESNIVSCSLVLSTKKTWNQLISIFFRKADFQLLGKLDDDRRYLEELIKNPVLKKHHDPTGEHFGSNVVRHKVTKNVF